MLPPSDRSNNLVPHWTRTPLITHMNCTDFRREAETDTFLNFFCFHMFDTAHNEERKTGV